MSNHSLHSNMTCVLKSNVLCEIFPSYNKFPLFNKFFNPNLCHFCKKAYDNNFDLCDECNMISYCNVDHKLKHYKYHSKICKCIQMIFKRHPQILLTCNLSLEEWIQTRKEFLYLLNLELPYVPQPDEVQMVTLAKSCFICHKQMDLEPCKRCYSINYCSNHARHLEDHYKSNCKNLKLCHELDFEQGFFTEDKMKFTQFPNDNKPTVDMDTFIEQYVCPTLRINGTLSKNFLAYFYSDYVSGPLTLYHGIQNINLPILFNSSDLHYIIHIIAANHVDREYLPAWELLLHLLPQICNLTIILTGMELDTERGNIEVCFHKCTKHLRQLNFETHCMLFHDYVSSNVFKQPDIIIGFQVDLNDWQAKKKSILKIHKIGCPIILTTKSEVKAEQNINKIETILKSHLFYLYFNENKYSSYRPYRDFKNNGVSYRNKYLTIFEKL